MIGKQLQHPDLGPCIVTKVIGAKEVEVDYPHLGMKGKRYRIVALIDPETGEAPKPLETKEPSEGQQRSPGKILDSIDGSLVEARQAILALRLGQCPEGYIDELTVGAEEVKEAAEWALERSDDGDSAIVIFESPFGKGKTHALNLFASMARRKHRAVGSVVLDGFGISLTEPMTLLSNLAEAIRFPEERGFETLPDRLCGLVQGSRVETLRARGADFLVSCLSQIPKEIADQPDAWEVVIDYLSCNVSASQAKQKLAGYRSNNLPPSLPPIIANRVDDRAERATMMLREWARACTVVGAGRGLVVLFDEADVDYDNTGFGEQAVKRRTMLFEALRNLEEARTRPFLSVGIAITPGEANYWGVEAVDELLAHLGGPCTRHVVLEDLSKRDFILLGVKVARIYGEAYETEVVSPDEARELAGELWKTMSRRVNDACLPRRFIREFLERLDLIAQR
jgi:hypothetical protein